MKKVFKDWAKRFSYFMLYLFVCYTVTIDNEIFDFMERMY